MSEEELNKKINAVKRYMAITGLSSEDAFNNADEFIKLIDSKNYEEAHKNLEELKRKYYELEKENIDINHIKI